MADERVLCDTQEGLVLCFVVFFQAGNMVQEIRLKRLVSVLLLAAAQTGILTSTSWMAAILDAIFLPERNNHALLPGAKPSHSPWAMEWAGVVPCPMLPQHPLELRLLDLLQQSLDIVWQGLL